MGDLPPLRDEERAFARAAEDRALAQKRKAKDNRRCVGETSRRPSLRRSVARGAGRFAEIADGVVVGSAVVRLVERHGKSAPAQVEKFVASLRRALD